MFSYTIEEMWDAEPEARVSAGCAMERIRRFDDMTGSGATAAGTASASQSDGLNDADSAEVVVNPGAVMPGELVHQQQPSKPAQVVPAVA